MCFIANLNTTNYVHNYHFFDFDVDPRNKFFFINLFSIKTNFDPKERFSEDGFDSE